MSSDPNDLAGDANPDEACPACGGAGGGPFGRANSAWDVESYECPRCEGLGVLPALPYGSLAEADEAPVARPGIAKTVGPTPEKKRRANAG